MVYNTLGNCAKAQELQPKYAEVVRQSLELFSVSSNSMYSPKGLWGFILRPRVPFRASKTVNDLAKRGDTNIGRKKE